MDAPHTGAYVRVEPFPTTPGAAWGASDVYVGITRLVQLDFSHLIQHSFGLAPRRWVAGADPLGETQTVLDT